MFRKLSKTINTLCRQSAELLAVKTCTIKVNKYIVSLLLEMVIVKSASSSFTPQLCVWHCAMRVRNALCGKGCELRAKSRLFALRQRDISTRVGPPSDTPLTRILGQCLDHVQLQAEKPAAEKFPPHSLTIALWEEDLDDRQTTRRIQSRGRNRSFIGLTS